MLTFAFGFVCGILATIVFVVVWHLRLERQKAEAVKRLIAAAEVAQPNLAITGSEKPGGLQRGVH